MKPKQLNTIKFLTVCFAPAFVGVALPTANAATRTWDGGAATNVLNTAANWSGDAVPSAAGDIAEWNGTVAGPLSLTSTGGWTPGSGNVGGTSISVTSGQTSSLTLSPTQNFGVGSAITVAALAGPVTISPTANIVLRGGNTIITNDSANVLTFGASIGNWNNGGGAARTVTFAGSGNTQIDGNFILGGANVFNPLTKSGAGTLTLNGARNGGDGGATGSTMATLVISEGTMKFGNAARIATDGVYGNYTSAITINGTFDWSSSATQTLTGVISGSGTIKQTAGNLTLTGNNTFGGITTITGGSLIVSGTGALESTITVNGASAKYLHNSTTASFQDIALTQGTVSGTGTISAVTVADNAGASITNGNGSGSSGALTLDTLTFNGDAAINLTDDGNTATPGIVVNGTLSTTPANGTITVNASNAFWNSGITYELVSAGTFSAAPSHFTLGTISGVTGRQAPSLVPTSSGIGLLVSGDNPKWTGLDNTNWVVGSTGPNGNWKLVTLNTQTNYIQGDVVLFDDSAAGVTVTVAISAADVSPAVVNFNNSKPYLINGPFGIAGGAVNKDGSGNLTISTPNTYTGGTTINSGTLTLSGAGTLGGITNTLTATGGIVSLGGTSQTIGSLAITGEATIQNGALTAAGLVASNPTGNATISSNLDLGTGTLGKSGDGTLTLSGTTTYSGATTLSGGILALSGSGSLGSSNIVTLNGGSLDLGGSSQFANTVTISALPSLGGVAILNGSLSLTAFNVNTTVGVTTVSANIEGSTGITRTGGGILSLTGVNTFTGPINQTGPGTVSIDGGSNSGSGAITYSSFGTSFTINSGSYSTSGITTSGLSEFRTLNVNAGILESSGNIFADTLAISINIDGGTLRSTNAAGISVFDYNNLVQVNAGGATLDTTTGDITVGNNTTMFATGNVPIPTVNRPQLNGTAGGNITLLGGKTLVSGITNNGLLTIQDNSTWNLNGISSSVSGLSGAGSVTTSSGAVALTINSGSTNTYSGAIAGAGNLSLVKQGAGTQELSGTGTFESDISVTAGILEVTNNSATSLSNNSVIRITTGGSLHLPNAVTDIVAGLVIDGVPLAPGTYNSASVETTGLITGSGQIQIDAGFANWMSQFTSLNAAQRLPNADPDSDSIPNLVEYAIAGLDPTAPDGAVGALTGLTVTYNKRADAVANNDVAYDIEASTDLGETDPWAIVTDSHVTETPALISYTFNPSVDGAADFVRLLIVGN